MKSVILAAALLTGSAAMAQADYPACSKTTADKCTESGAMSKPMAHHMGKHPMMHHRKPMMMHKTAMRKTVTKTSTTTKK